MSTSTSESSVSAAVRKCCLSNLQPDLKTSQTTQPTFYQSVSTSRPISVSLLPPRTSATRLPSARSRRFSGVIPSLLGPPPCPTVTLLENKLSSLSSELHLLFFARPKSTPYLPPPLLPCISLPSLLHWFPLLFAVLPHALILWYPNLRLPLLFLFRPHCLLQFRLTPLFQLLSCLKFPHPSSNLLLVFCGLSLVPLLAYLLFHLLYLTQCLALLTSPLQKNPSVPLPLFLIVSLPLPLLIIPATLSSHASSSHSPSSFFI